MTSTSQPLPAWPGQPRWAGARSARTRRRHASRRCARRCRVPARGHVDHRVARRSRASRRGCGEPVEGLASGGGRGARGSGTCPAKVPSPLSCSARNVSASAVRASRPSRIASCRSARSWSIVGEHPPRRLPQPLGIVGRARPGARSRRLGRRATASAAATCSGVASTGACSAALTITRTCSSRSSPAANASRVAAYLSRSSRGDPQPTGHLLARASGQPGQPRVGAGLRGLVRHPSAVRLGRQREPQRRGPRLDPCQLGDGRTQSAVVEQLHRRTACASQQVPCLGDNAADVVLDAGRSRRPVEQRGPHTRMVSNTRSNINPSAPIAHPAANAVESGRVGWRLRGSWRVGSLRWCGLIRVRSAGSPAGEQGQGVVGGRSRARRCR